MEPQGAMGILHDNYDPIERLKFNDIFTIENVLDVTEMNLSKAAKSVYRVRIDTQNHVKVCDQLGHALNHHFNNLHAFELVNPDKIIDMLHMVLYIAKHNYVVVRRSKFYSLDCLIVEVLRYGLRKKKRIYRNLGFRIVAKPESAFASTIFDYVAKPEQSITFNFDEHGNTIR